MGWIYNGAEFVKANKAQRQAYSDFKRHELAIGALSQPYTVPVLGLLGALGAGASIASLIAPYLAELLDGLSPDSSAFIQGLPSWKQLLIMANPLYLQFQVAKLGAQKGEEVGLEIREKILSLNLGNRLFSVFR